MIRNKDQKLKDKYIEMIDAKFCARKYKRGEGYERYDKVSYQKSLIQYQRSLQMREKTMEDAIAAIQSGGDGNEQLLSFNVALKMQEKTMEDAIATIQSRGKHKNKLSLIPP